MGTVDVEHTLAQYFKGEITISDLRDIFYHNTWMLQEGQMEYLRQLASKDDERERRLAAAGLTLDQARVQMLTQQMTIDEFRHLVYGN